MARKQAVPICSRCETPLRSANPFCADCGGPTPWATHEDRVAWEVRQWRASRAREPERPAPMMLVRTDEGFKAASIDPRTQYVWDQPLHPEREKQAEATAAREAVLKQPVDPRAGNGHNGNAHPGNGHAAAQAPATTMTAPPLLPRIADGPVFETHPVPTPSDAPIAAPVEAAELEELAGPEEPAPPPVSIAAAPGPVFATSAPAAHAESVAGGDETVSLSKTAIALAIALVVGLPLGSRVLNLTHTKTEAARAPAAAAGEAPAPLVPARSGFVALSGDAARYAVVIRNPNKAAAARGVAVSVALYDARGRLIGNDADRVSVIPPGATTAVVGTTDTDGTPARLVVRLTIDGFLGGTPGKLFTVRDVKVVRRGGDLMVRAAVSAARAVRGARVVAVHYDARGTIIGGDLTYVDIPHGRSTTAVVATSGAARRVRTVDVFVLAPR